MPVSSVSRFKHREYSVEHLTAGDFYFCLQISLLKVNDKTWCISAESENVKTER